MAAPKVKEPKQPFTYRAKPSIVKDAKKMAKKNKTTISQAIEGFLELYGNDLYELQSV
jgi:hypothetical protein